MSSPGKLILGIVVTLCIVLAAAFFFLRHLVSRSFSETSGVLNVPGLKDPVEIARDANGIPHITAGNQHDLIFAAGYVHAQDRLWQMDLTRRAGEGRLSEIFDTATVRYDRLFRTLGLAVLADSLYAHLHSESRQILIDYADGVNAFIATHKGKYPIEFDMLNYDPEPWKPQHSLLTARLMAWQMNFGWWVDLTYASIAGKVDEKKFREILPGYPESVAGMAPQITAGLSSRLAGDVRALMATARGYREWSGDGAFGACSNAWAVSGARTMSGKPLLANDPHLRTAVPGKWYEMHLSAPGWNVAGVSIPGAPLVIIGHNDSLAWGLTNAMLDDADFYIERLDSAKPGMYKFRNGLLPFTERTELIRIGNNDSTMLTVRSTIHGPVISGVRPGEGASKDTLRNEAISLRWTGFELSDELFAVAAMDRAANAEQFENGVKEFQSPAQSLVYADAAGNIGFWMMGRVPIRGGGNPMLPLPGWTGDAEWQGWLPFADHPKSWNPPGGTIVCANQKPVLASYPYYLSTYWEPPSRGERIRELLSGPGKFTAEDFQQFQMDITSPFDREITKEILAAYPDSLVENAGVRTALEYLKNWDYRETPTDIATTIFNMFFVKLLHNTYEDEMGPETFDDFIQFAALPYRVTAQLLAADSSAWFDDVRTPKVETKRDIIHKSMLDAIAALAEQMGGEMKNWQWGTIHQAEFEHPFGKRKPLDRVFNVGPYPLGGSETTVNRAEFDLNAPFTLVSGPSMRQIVDLSKPEEALMILPLGESGQALHPHYDDQTAQWLNGGYHRVTINNRELDGMKLDRLTLRSK